MNNTKVIEGDKSMYNSHAFVQDSRKPTEWLSYNWENQFTTMFFSIYLYKINWMSFVDFVGYILITKGQRQTKQISSQDHGLHIPSYISKFNFKNSFLLKNSH